MATYTIGPVETVIPSSLATSPASITYQPDTSTSRWVILEPVNVDNGDSGPQRPTSGILFP